MSEQLIDDFNSGKKVKPSNRLVKIVVIVSTLLFIILSLLYSIEIHIIIGNYYTLRHKLIDRISTNSIINAITISLMPIIAYHVWLKGSNFVKIRSYLLLLFFAIILFVGFLVLGFELILQTGLDYSSSNPLLPTYMLTPRFPYSFMLVFVFSAILSFLFLNLLFGKKSRKSAH